VSSCSSNSCESGKAESHLSCASLGVDILEGFIALDSESQARNISAWTPVVAEVLQGICSWDDNVLQEHISVLYPLTVDLLARDMSSEVRESVRSGESLR
jgi:brefeldin A-inhibited guanine nucleotide-exchange protein